MVYAANLLSVQFIHYAGSHSTTARAPACLWLLPLQKACRKDTRRRPSSSSEGADGDDPEPPKPEPPDEPELPKPASTEPANTECAICLDDNAEYAAVPCGHRCLCADCSKTVSQCPVCRTKMSAVLRVFV